MLDDQVSMRDALIERIRTKLAAEPRVAALWLGGSLGRGEGDELSDVDLVVVVDRATIATFVEALFDLVGATGDVALVNEAPQNAPADGGQLNVLYDTDPLPLYVDWNVWPHMGVRPSDVHVLFERQPSSFVTGATFESVLEGMGRNAGRAKDADGWCRFRLFMAPIVAKHAARGWFESVDNMLGYMRYEGIEAEDFEAVESRLNEIMDECGGAMDDRAVSCVSRYLDTLASQRRR